MQRVTRAPADTTVVVAVRTRQTVREHGTTIAIFAVTAVLAGVGVAETGSLVWAVIGVLCLGGVALEVLLVRAQAGFGPLLAADSDHVWVRTGGFLSPRSVLLEWPEITAVTLHLWRGRRKDTARYLSFDLTDAALASLTTDPRVAKRARRLTRTFGSPLAIAEQHGGNLGETLRELRRLAPDGVRFLEKT